LGVRCTLSVFSCVYLVCYDFIFAFPKTTSQLCVKPRASSNDRICLGKKNIRIIIIGLQRHEDLFFAEYRPVFTGVKKTVLCKKKCHRTGFVSATYCKTFHAEISGTDKLSTKTRKQTTTCLLVKPSKKPHVINLSEHTAKDRWSNLTCLFTILPLSACRRCRERKLERFLRKPNESERAADSICVSPVFNLRTHRFKIKY